MKVNDVFLFMLPTQVHYGYNSIVRAGQEAERLHINNALIVTDQGLLDAGVLGPLLKDLGEKGLGYEIFRDVPIDPDTQVVKKGEEFLKKKACDGIMAIGGGSVLCAGKGIALVATNGGNVRDYEGLGNYKRPPLPLIAIPTTAGSGSEVSAVFIISDENRDNYKMTIGGYLCFPNSAILDPLLLRSLPAEQFIVSGVDALVHAIEATCTNQATPLTDAMAYEAIRIIMAQLTRAALTADLEAKRDQLYASTMANIACGNAKLGLVHATAQPLGSYHVAHGLGVGILLPYVMEFNLPACETKLARMAEIIGAAAPTMPLREKAKAAIEAVKRLYMELNFKDRLTEDLAPKEKIPEMVKIAMGRPQLKFNLRQAGEGDLAEIYAKAYQGWHQGSSDERQAKEDDG